jgi:hypothetical protein
MITFTQQMWDAVKEGRKTQTRRLWKKRRALPGSVHQVRAPGQFGPIVGSIRVLSVRMQCLGDVTEEEARAESFANLAEFLAYLASLHKGKPLDRDTIVWALEFELLEATNAQA